MDSDDSEDDGVVTYAFPRIDKLDILQSKLETLRKQEQYFEEAIRALEQAQATTTTDDSLIKSNETYTKRVKLLYPSNKRYLLESQPDIAGVLQALSVKQVNVTSPEPYKRYLTICAQCAVFECNVSVVVIDRADSKNGQSVESFTCKVSSWVLPEIGGFIKSKQDSNDLGACLYGVNCYANIAIKRNAIFERLATDYAVKYNKSFLHTIQLPEILLSWNILTDKSSFSLILTEKPIGNVYSKTEEIFFTLLSKYGVYRAVRIIVALLTVER